MISGNMAEEIPNQVAEAGLDQWYATLSQQDRVRVRRYLNGISTDTPVAFLNDLISRAEEDRNYRLAVTAGEYLEGMDLDDYGRFVATNGMIEGLFGCDEFTRAKELCCRNLDLFPSVEDRVRAENGGDIPQKMPCRNRLIDILVGVEANYDDAVAVLDQYAEMGLIDPVERDQRKQSLKIHRMQMFFDNVYNYDYKKDRSRRPSRGSSGGCRWRAPRRGAPPRFWRQRPPGPPP